MITTLKIQNWKTIVPFNFYLTPMSNQIKKVRDILLKMEKDGHLRIKYVIEDNRELKDEVTAMIKLD